MAHDPDDALHSIFGPAEHDRTPGISLDTSAPAFSMTSRSSRHGVLGALPLAIPLTPS